MNIQSMNISRNFFRGFALLGLLVLTSCSKHPPYDDTLNLQGVTFRVFGEGNEVVIHAKGEALNATEHVPRGNSLITGSEVADLNSDGIPEVYVYLHSHVGHQGALVAFVAGEKSLMPIYLPGLHSFDNGRHLVGYFGKDDFAVVENTLVHRFPISGGITRQIQYKLKKGEATWILELDKVVEY